AELEHRHEPAKLGHEGEASRHTCGDPLIEPEPRAPIHHERAPAELHLGRARRRELDEARELDAFLGLTVRDGMQAEEARDVEQEAEAAADEAPLHQNPSSAKARSSAAPVSAAPSS